MSRTKPEAVLLAALALVPALAAGRPACCIKLPAAVHSCCPARPTAQASGPKGCCKAPAAPKPDSRVNTRTPLELGTAAMGSGGPAQTPITLPAIVSVRLARRAHRAEAPEESPPDLLQRIHVLLI